jgi:hypothetical protein
MSDKPPYVPATEADVKAHRKAQPRSPFLPPGKRDKGIALVESATEVAGIITNEIEAGPTPVFKLRSTAIELPDPVSRTQTLIRAKTQKNLSQDEFLELVEDDDDYQLFLILYGNMSDSQRASHLSKYADRKFRKQQEVLKQHNIQQAQEERRKKNALAAMKAMKGLWADDKAPKTPPKTPPLPKEDDGE